MQRHLDEFAQLFAQRVQAADVGPRHVGPRDQRFAQRRRPNVRERVLEVGARDRELVGLEAERGAVVGEHRGVAAQRGEAGFAAEFHQVGADEAVRAIRDVVERGQRVGRQRHLARVDVEHLAPAGGVGRADEDLAVEAARPAERRIDGCRAGWSSRRRPPSRRASARPSARAVA